MTSIAQVQLYYVLDPMCSWCWGYRPEWTKLREALPDRVRVLNVLGGLAPDSDQPMTPEMQRRIRGHWRRIRALLGTEFNEAFWDRCQPRRDTYKACRAVVVAAAQKLEEEMIRAIQHAYYLRAMNPSEPEVLARLAFEIGLDPERFRNDLESAATQAEFQRHLDLRHALGVHSFPSLVLDIDGRIEKLPVNYRDHQKTLQNILTLTDTSHCKNKR